MSATDDKSQSRTPAASKPLDVAAVRKRLTEARGPRYWRSLSELAQTAEFEELVHREFPRHAAEWPEGVSRRGFLELSAASLALAGLTGCTRQPEESIIPYVQQPEDIIPGKPMMYATSFEVGGYSQGLLVESHMGRPTKVEGNPEHPASLGATDLWSQAAILGLYDPDRSQVVSHLTRPSMWSQFVKELEPRIIALSALGGEGLRILTGTVTSPTVGAQLVALLAKLPKARWHQWEPAGPHSTHHAAVEAFGVPVSTRYELGPADVVVALDADFLVSGPGAVRYAREFGQRRKVGADAGGASMNRLYCLESSPTPTSALADHRLALEPRELLAFAAALAAAVGVPGASAGTVSDARQKQQLDALAADLLAHRGRSVVVAGEAADARLHVLAHALNGTLGNVGTTVVHTEPVEISPVDQLASIAELAADMKAGKVDTLIILGANPVYDAPAELDFAAALSQVPFRAHLSLYEDETSGSCHWHLPAAHPFESWGDGRAFDGTLTLQQPLIQPLYGGRSAAEVLSLFGPTTDQTPYESLRARWQVVLAGASSGFEAAWRRAVHDGLVAGSAAAVKAVSVASAAVARACGDDGSAREGAFTLLFRPDPGVFDGRFANNGWLQECPRPLTKLTWDNALWISPHDAEALGVTSEGLVEIEAGGTRVTAPVWVQPGHAKGAVTLHLGFGRSRVGRVGNGVGVNAYSLRNATSPWAREGVSLRKVSGHYALASTQEHFDLELQTEEAAERHHVRFASLAELRHDPDAISKQGHAAPGPEQSMYPPHPYTGDYSWGLAVDLSACTGCNACVVACQSENNIATVGKEQVAKGREMHWMRIDRYFRGDLDDPGVDHQPVMCMHCDLAPCEVVCPVAATVHGPEGLNEMVYNRCVGTRYCSNNCPYKVRRFNFLLYSDFETQVLRLQRNPDVTIRSRGVMEKCTYCVQRINHARIDAKRESRKIKDGEVKTACQQACPADAIVFGNLNDPTSEVNRSKANPRNYGLLGELGTRPRTTYLAKINNPNPVWPKPSSAAGHQGGHV